MKCKQHFTKFKLELILLCRALYGFRYGDRTIGGGKTIQLWRRRRENNRIEEEKEEGKQ